MKLEKITELSRAILNRECRFDGSTVGKTNSNRAVKWTNNSRKIR